MLTFTLYKILCNKKSKCLHVYENINALGVAGQDLGRTWSVDAYSCPALVFVSGTNLLSTVVISIIIIIYLHKMNNV